MRKNSGKQSYKRRHEDPVTHVVDEGTKMIPSLGFFGLAVGSMASSAALTFFKKRELGNFIGLWAPTILIMGLYNKLVKVEHELSGATA